MTTLLSISFRLAIPTAEWEQLAASMAKELSAVPGLHWKIWLLEPEQGEVAGVYLFEDERSLRAYLDGPIAASLRSAAWIRDLRVQSYEIMQAETEITRGPVREPVQA
jgi:hypothetical protein